MPLDILVASFPIDRRLAVASAVIAAVVLVIFLRRNTSPRCPRCQQLNREPAVFCAQCGTRLRKP